jgi:hypothetical protein
MRTLRLVAGSIVVYAIVACGSAAMGPSLGEATQDASAPRVVDAASMGAALADALANPVPEAAAQSLSPIVATENCDKSWPAPGYTNVSYLYAEHAFPGYTAAQLSAVRALTVYASSTSVPVPPGYTQYQNLAFVRDGYAAIQCGSTTPSGTTLTFSSVTFILPQ